MSLLNSVLTAEWLLNVAVQSCLILIFGWVFICLFRHCSAPLRSGISMTAMLALVLLLLISFSMAGLHLHPFHTVFSVTLDTVPLSEMDAADLSRSNSADNHPAGLSPSIVKEKRGLFAADGTGSLVIRAVNLFGIIWGIGFLIQLFRFLVGVFSIRTLKEKGSEIRDSRVNRILEDVETSFSGHRKTRIFSSSRVPYPMAAGIFKPFILMPQSLLPKLRDSEIRGILLHELSHVHHRDHIAGILQRIVKAVYWWNPLAYALSNAHSRTREEISDNHALLLNDAKEYAECLISLAEKTAYFKRAVASTGMASSHIPLMDRVKHILSRERIMETSMKKSYFVVIIVVAFLILAGITGTRLTFATGNQDRLIETQEGRSPQWIKRVEPVYPEQVRAAGIEGTVVIEAQTDPEGNVILLKIRKGAHDLLNKAAVEALIQWKFKPALINGIPHRIEFTVSFRFSLADEKPGISITREVVVPEEEASPVRAVGEIKPPKLIKKVEPVYPEIARQAQVEGVVILEATTDIYGRVKAVRVLRSIPLLDQAAVDAVRQWVYEPMIIDGEPRGVIFTVTVSFKLDEKKPKAGVFGIVGQEDQRPPIRATGEIKPPKLIKKVEPVYPEQAKKAGIGGVVILEVTTDVYGRVKAVRVLRSIPLLDQAAVDAVRQWVYEPMIIDGEPRGVIFTVTVSFNIK